MSLRARASALALVNWKGVFYERYLLDRHVTALEGANGAGKTTVMIAAYVVLLPDMSRLRFTNLGESGATGGDKGIWGRLGEIGRPSYAVLEIALPQGERVLAGVHLERKAEPSVELTPFIVKGLNLEGRLREALLLVGEEEDQVPELGELRASLQRLGATLEVFASAKDYFAALFELGVTPLRLASDAERNKLNEMLRTSMTGGISRALTSELRSFLLKEETGLSTTLTRMRANLDACQRTRHEVTEAQQLEHEIAGVFAAGQMMFAAALFACRRASDELALRLERAREQHQQPQRALDELDASVGEALARQGTIHARVAAAREGYEAAALQRDRAVRAHALLVRSQELEAERESAHARVTAAREQHASAAAERTAQRVARDRAREAYDRATYGLGHLQSGLEELHRNAHAHRRAVTELQAARDALAAPELAATDADAALASAQARLAALDHERAELDRDLQLLHARSEAWSQALAALAELVDHVEPERAHEQARSALSRLTQLEERVRQSTDLAAELDRSRKLARRQLGVRTRSAELAVPSEQASALHVEHLLAEAEGQLRTAELAARSQDAAAAAARVSAADAHKRLAALTLRQTRWTEIEAQIKRLGTRLSAPTRRAVHEARTHWAEARERQRQRALQLSEERDDLLRQASALVGRGGDFPADLLRIRDELGAELLVDRFEELELDEAALLQARLGPLAQALVLEDPLRGAQALQNRPRELASLWLVDTSVDLSAGEAGTLLGEDLLVREAAALRLTHLPSDPTLGRAARERRAEQLRERAETRTLELEQVLAEVRELEQHLREADALLEVAELLEAGDPSALVAATHAERDAAASAEAFAVRASSEAVANAASLRPRVEGLRALLGEAHLLDEPEYAQRCAELEQRLGETNAARQELAARAAARRVLTEHAETLRLVPPSPQTHDAQEIRREQLEAERDRLFAASQALASVMLHRHALCFVDAERLLDERAQVVPALERQHEQAKAAVAQAEAALASTEAAWEQATAQHLTAEAALQALDAHLERVNAELAEQGVSDPSNEALEGAQAALSDASALRSGMEREEHALAAELALRQERRGHAARLLESSRLELLAAEREAIPARELWAELQHAASASGVLQSAVTQRFEDAFEGRSSLELWSEARGKSALLCDRLRGARGGSECATDIDATLTGEGTLAKSYLLAWQLTRDWLKRRLPAPIADVDDPLEALDRLRNDLSMLELRLGRQENDLRGASEDVARGIEVQLRRAKGQVRRLNQNLEGVRFGSISAIRVQMRRVERMEQVLRALREGAAQELLFSSQLPIEEALDEIFRRYGGGRSGGQKILDYREYLELGVEIQRQTSNDWEIASPTKLSTGEAIGVGAALMMVVLTEWERDANLLRGKRHGGSLRFLFLDEANRLSQENLGVLFDLCENLDLQLMIAAPEVAQAHGNTTYRLVRRLAPGGGEEVIVSGRRTLIPEVVETPLSVQPVQLPLLGETATLYSSSE